MQIKTDGFAVASVVCGFTAVIPILSQLMGLAFGIVAVVRIRRASRAGGQLGGARMAVAGIISSGAALAGWVGFILVLVILSDSLSGITEPLTAVLQRNS